MLDEEKHIEGHGEEPQKELEGVSIDALPVVGDGAVHHKLQRRKEATCLFLRVWAWGGVVVEVVRWGNM